MSAVHFQRIGPVTVRCLGPIDGADVLVVVGRNNPTRKSASLDAMLTELHRRGLSICWYQSPVTQARTAIDDAVRAVLPRAMAARYFNISLSRSLLRWSLKSLLLLFWPRYWWFFAAWYEERRHTSLKQLRRFLRALPAARIFVFSQSAGGIAASLIADGDRIEKLVCFGYPFLHPLRGEAPYRTAHLAQLATPLLIIQGERDIYGRMADAGRYALSRSIRVEAVDATHDYEGLSTADFEKSLAWISRHLGLAGPDAGA